MAGARLLGLGWCALGPLFFRWSGSGEAQYTLDAAPI